MLTLIITFVVTLTAADSLPDPAGAIQGVVLNGSDNNRPWEGIDVVLRAGAHGELAVAAETKTDRYGNFVFAHVPLDPAIEYVAGANRGGVHYPGQHVHLGTDNPVAQVTLVAFDTVMAPCPLVAKRHDIEVTVEEHALRIREALLIANPTRTTYVGQPMGGGAPVTFWLTIPQDFDRVTFDREFYGRQFSIIDHLPVTQLPWLPGAQELRFTYHVPLAENDGRFRRPMDVPSSNVRVTVRGANTRQVKCNLPQFSSDDGVMIFAAEGAPLERGFAVELQVDALPWPWVDYARWGSVVLLVALAAGTVAIVQARRRRTGVSPRSRQRHERLLRRGAA